MEAPLKRKFEEEEGAVDRHVAQKCEEEEVAVTEADCAKYGQSEEEDTDNLTSDQRAPEVRFMIVLPCLACIYFTFVAR
eukprot:1793978-Pyramimonas_sp.AAC.2